MKRTLPALFTSLGLLIAIPTMVHAQAEDFGDAPASYDAGGGGPARHGLTGPMLGTMRDADPSPQSSAGADGDDLDADGDDDDGVTFLDPFIIGMVSRVQVVVTGSQSARLSGYFDWTANGNWNHLTNELGIHNVLLSPGTHVINVTVPNDAVPGTTYARFKLYISTSPGTPARGQRDDGEVEDYQIEVLGAVDIESSTWGAVKALFR